jgi:deoxyribodipyrimidine photo-lyase
MVHSERIKNLNTRSEQSGEYVLYWMQQSARAHYNHALELALQQAESLGLPLLVVFVLTDNFPEANLRHYRFLLEGLEDTRARLTGRGIQMAILRGEPVAAVSAVAARAAMLVCDRGYLRIQRQWRAAVAGAVGCRCIQVESDVVVPIESAYPKEAYTAGILRPKLHAVLEKFLVELSETPVQQPSLETDFGLQRAVAPVPDCSLIPADRPLTGPDGLEAELEVDRSIEPVDWIHGGTTAALRRLEQFLATKIDRFHELRNDPSVDYLSHLSPYLHFGHISALYIVLQVQSFGPGAAAFIEELVVRRELAMNFAYYNPDYDRYKCLPEWAHKTLSAHEVDRRDYLYPLEQLEAGKTHDPYWNAAQRELTGRGKMHGYMRMYWGKKILEWSPRPREAFERALYLNNKYSLDGRDANGFAGVAWCFGKHDRAWPERPVFGKTRYMNANGLKRKFDIEAYVQKLS